MADPGIGPKSNNMGQASGEISSDAGFSVNIPAHYIPALGRWLVRHLTLSQPPTAHGARVSSNTDGTRFNWLRMFLYLLLFSGSIALVYFSFRQHPTDGQTYGYILCGFNGSNINPQSQGHIFERGERVIVNLSNADNMAYVTPANRKFPVFSQDYFKIPENYWSISNPKDKFSATKQICKDIMYDAQRYNLRDVCGGEFGSVTGAVPFFTIAVGTREKDVLPEVLQLRCRNDSISYIDQITNDVQIQKIAPAKHKPGHSNRINKISCIRDCHNDKVPRNPLSGQTSTRTTGPKRDDS